MNEDHKVLKVLKRLNNWSKQTIKHIGEILDLIFPTPKWTKDMEAIMKDRSEMNRQKSRIRSEKSLADAYSFCVGYDGRMLKEVPERFRTPDLCMKAVLQNPDALQYAHEQSRELCLAAISKNYRALRFVKDQTTELCMAAIKQDPFALLYVREQTPELCREAVRQEPFLLANVRERTEELNLLAVQQEGLTLKLISNPSLAVCVAAVRQNPSAMQCVPKELADRVQALTTFRQAAQSVEKGKTSSLDSLIGGAQARHDDMVQQGNGPALSTKESLAMGR